MATGTLVLYAEGLKALLAGNLNWGADTLVMKLCNSTYIPNQDTDAFDQEVHTNIYELSTEFGYTAGGKALTGRSTIEWDDNDDNVSAYVAKAADLVWTGCTGFVFRYAVLVDEIVNTPPKGTGRLIGYIDFGGNQTATGVLTIAFPTDTSPLSAPDITNCVFRVGISHAGTGNITEPYAIFCQAMMGGLIALAASDQLKLLLITDAYTPSVSTDYVVSEITSAYELEAGAGYATGGVVVTGVAFTSYNAGTNKLKFDADNTIFSLTAPGATFRYGLLVDHGSDPDQLIAYIDFGNQTLSDTFTVEWSSLGILELYIYPPA